MKLWRWFVKYATQPAYTDFNGRMLPLWKSLAIDSIPGCLKCGVVIVPLQLLIVFIVLVIARYTGILIPK
jgi:hypothetical protein